MHRLLSTFFTTFIVSLVSCSFAMAVPPQTGDVMTPYVEARDASEYFAGTTFVIDGLSNMEITEELERMRHACNINTITVYGLEGLSNSTKNHLFNELYRLGMKIVVRIESYDADTFAFTVEDAQDVLNRHRDIIEYVSSANRRNQVAYFAVNMPVDDTKVQKNAGGLNSKAWRDAQVVYAREIIDVLTSELDSNGFTDAKLYLSVHYGWDNSFSIPSYADSGADGYFINCYSYPAVRYGVVPKADASVERLIDTPQIDECMEIYHRQYGDAPVVMEFGFHTLEYNNWVRPDQTAGLVYDRAAKKRAMQETIKYYDEKYPYVQGALYFGYNLLKEEGSDHAVMDWCLVYPSAGTVYATDAIARDVVYTEDGTLELTSKGSTATFRECPQLQQIAIRYSAPSGGEIQLLTNGRKKKNVMLEASDSIRTIGIPLVVVEGYDLTIENISDNPVYIESVVLSPFMEAEYQVENFKNDDKASHLAYVDNIGSKDRAISFNQTRGGELFSVCYRSDVDCNLYISLDGRTARFPLKATSRFSEKSAKLPIYRDASFSIYSDSDALQIDYVNLSGIPVIK